MSFIPGKAMHRAHAEPGEAPDETGKIVPLDGDGGAETSDGSHIGWILGAAGAGIAVAAVAASLFALRSSGGRRPARRRPRAKPGQAKAGTAKTAKSKAAGTRRRTSRKTAAAA